MLRGYDLSHHNSNVIFDKCTKEGDFIIIKATEGKTYIDPTFKERICKINTGLCGVYHYARPENNTPDAEVNNFYNTIKEYMTDTMLIVLDWEGNALKYSFDWAIRFCTLMEQKTHRPCIIYASASVVRKYANQHLYWWTAHYNASCENGCSHDNVNEVLTQFTSTPYDTNIFHGTTDDWLILCGKKKEVKQVILAEWVEGNKHYYVLCEG